jgi:hypothetical protein
MHVAAMLSELAEDAAIRAMSSTSPACFPPCATARYESNAGATPWQSQITAYHWRPDSSRRRGPHSYAFLKPSECLKSNTVLQ